MSFIKKIFKNFLNKTATSSISIPTHLDNIPNKINPQLYASESDLVYFSGSKLCPLCSIYNRRIFSKSGKDKRFPPIAKLPDNLHSVNCPECGTYLGFSNYYAINVDGELKSHISESNRPFTDIRTISEKQLYETEKQNKLLKEQTKVEYSWLCENFPDIAPKSLSGYSRMKNSNSANYQKILLLMKEKGFDV